MRTLAGTAAFALAVSISACGDPAGPERIEFTFTPVAVYTFVATPTRIEESPLSLDEQCISYIADEVIAIVQSDATEDFEGWLNKVGFSRRRSFDSTLGLHVTIGVPPGSVPDAVVLISRQDGVVSASKNYNLADDGSFGRRLACTPIVTAEGEG